MRYFAIGMALLLVGMGTQGLASEEDLKEWFGYLDKGNTEQDIMLGVSLPEYDDNQDGGDWSGGNFQFGHGKFLTRNLSAGFRLGGMYSLDRETQNYSANLGGVAKYHFFDEEDTVIPYVGGQIGLQHNWIEHAHDSEDRAWGFFYGPVLGIKLFESSNISIFAEYQYRFFAGDLTDIYDLEHVFFFGVSLTH